MSSSSCYTKSFRRSSFLLSHSLSLLSTLCTALYLSLSLSLSRIQMFFEAVFVELLFSHWPHFWLNFIDRFLEIMFGEHFYGTAIASRADNLFCWFFESFLNIFNQSSTLVLNSRPQLSSSTLTHTHFPINTCFRGFCHSFPRSNANLLPRSSIWDFLSKCQTTRKVLLFRPLFSLSLSLSSSRLLSICVAIVV